MFGSIMATLIIITLLFIGSDIIKRYLCLLT